LSFSRLDSVDNRCIATITLSVQLIPSATVVELQKVHQTYLFEHEHCPQLVKYRWLRVLLKAYRDLSLKATRIASNK